MNFNFNKKLLEKPVSLSAALLLAVCLTACGGNSHGNVAEGPSSQTEAGASGSQTEGSEALHGQQDAPMFGQSPEKLVDKSLLCDPGRVISFDADYHSIVGSKADITIDEEAVRQEIDFLINNNITYVEVKDRTSLMGDRLNIDIVGKIGDDILIEEHDYDLELGSGTIDDVENYLEGLAEGDQISMDLDYSEVGHEEEDEESESGESQAGEKDDGEKIHYEIEVHKVMMPVAPEYNDAFIAANTSYKTVEAFEAGIRSELENVNKRDVIANWIAEHAIMGECPDDLYQKYEKRLLKTYEMFSQDMGISMEEFWANMGVDSVEEFLQDQDTKDSLLGIIQTEMAYNYLAEQEELLPTYGELEAFVEYFAAKNGIEDVSEVTAHYDEEEILHLYCEEYVTEKLLEYCTFN